MADHRKGTVHLRIVALTSAQGMKEYYESIQTAYYAGEGACGEWGGAGADLLKLRGSVQAEKFKALVDNLDPSSVSGGKPRQLTPRIKANRRVAYDANTHAPKSASLMCAMGGDRRVLDAHHAATVQMMGAMEKLAATRVRSSGASTDRPTGNLVWAAFSDMATRPVDGIEDPHLHEHVVIFNATFDPVEKRWKAAQFGEIKRQAPLLQAMFSMNLARKMQEMGYELTWDGPRWEIKGVPTDLMARFSRRSALIDECAERRGIRSDKEKAKLGARTREKKTKRGAAELSELWTGQLSPEERELLANLKAQAHGRTAKSPSTVPMITPAMAVRGAIERLSENASIWTRDDFLREALYAGHGAVELAQIEAVLETPEFADSGPRRLLRKLYRGVEIFTTEEILREEQRCIELAREGRGKFDALGAVLTNNKVGNRRLSDEQMAAARRLAASEDFVTCLLGKAGTGKSTLVKAVMPSLQAMNRQVITLAPTHKAVDVLKADGFSDAMTLSKFLAGAPNQEIPDGTVLWLDEAGLTGTRHMAHLLRIAKSKGCRVVLAGDTSQHTAVARGDALRLLIQRADLTAASVSTIVRQNAADYREAVQQLAQGKTDPESPERGLRILQRRGSILTYPDALDRFDEAAKKIAALVAAKESHLAIAPTHHEITTLTTAVRQELSTRGLIQRETAREISVLRERSLTSVEKRAAFLYQVGDVIELNQRVKWGERGQRFTVTDFDSDNVTIRDERGHESSLHLNDAEKFQVFERSVLELAVGDRIRITRTSQVGDERFIGGSIHAIKRFDAEGNIMLDDGSVLPRDFGHLDYGWATTSHSAQGMTVDHVVIVQSAASGRAASLEQVYVSASRGKKDVWIFTDDAESLKKAVAHSSERTSALEAFMPAEGAAVRVQQSTTQLGAGGSSISANSKPVRVGDAPTVATGHGYSKAILSHSSENTTDVPDKAETRDGASPEAF